MQTQTKKKTIALVLENIFTDFAHEFIQNVKSGIQGNKNINLVVISGKYDGNKDMSDNSHRYKRVYNSIYSLENLCEFDGIIVCLGSMAYVDREVIMARYFTEQLKKVPKVFAIADIEGHICVNYDNETGIREAVDCLVNARGFRKICMLGGREDNIDSERRKLIFAKCLKENGITFTDDNYEATDMSANSIGKALALMKRNPDMEAVFCVNDAVAAAMYSAMRSKDLTPGKDITVFGFDNTKMAGNMIPTLASIGPSDTTLGQRAAEILIKLLNGNSVASEYIPTRLYGRESFDYDMYEYTIQEMVNVDKDFVLRMFDDCFYRYKYEFCGRENVDIRRLFCEFITRMLMGLKNKYMSMEEFTEIKELIDIFFDNGAMLYTDARKLVKSIDRIQSSANATQGNNVYINRLFGYMKDKAIISLSNALISETDRNVREIKMFQYFMVETTDYGQERDFLGNLIQNFDKLGLQNAAFYTFDEPVLYDEDADKLFPDTLSLRCVTKSGELFVMPPERRETAIKRMFTRDSLPSAFSNSVAFPIIYKEYIYGFLIVELTLENIDSGEYIADQLGRSIYLAGLSGNS